MAAQHSLFQRLSARRAEARASGWTAIDLGGHEVVGRLHMRIKTGLEAAEKGRRALDRLEGHIDAEKLAELRLLITELLTNSVRHAGVRDDWIDLDIEIYANAVRVVVTDHGPGFEPQPTPRPHADRPGGWGLCLVDRLADRWCVDRNDETAVWFEFDRGPYAATA